MFHHIAMFRFQDDVTDATVAGLRTRLLELPEQIDTIRKYHVGTNAGVSPGAWDMVVVALFDDAAGYTTYSAHPDHTPIVQEILGLVSDRAAIQSDNLH